MFKYRSIKGNQKKVTIFRGHWNYLIFLPAEKVRMIEQDREVGDPFYITRPSDVEDDEVNEG